MTRWLPATLLPLALGCGTAAPARSTVQVASASPPAAPPPPSDAMKACDRGVARLLGNLSGEVEAVVYATGEIPKLTAIAGAIGDMLAGYERLVPNVLRHRVVAIKTAADAQAAKEDGLMEGELGTAATDDVRKGFLGIAFKYRAEKETMGWIPPDKPQGVALWIAGKIRELYDRSHNGLHKVGVLTGKDEIKISDANLMAATGRGIGPSLRGVMEQALPFYKFEDVDLQGGEADINKELDGLIVTQPGKDFTDKELRRIDQFLMLGKSMAIYAGAANVKSSDAGMKAKLDTHGLERLLGGYGVEMKRDLVFDWGSPSTISIQTGGAPVRFAFPPAPLAVYDARAKPQDQSLDQDFPGFFRLEELAFPFPSTLIPHPDRQPGATVTVVARTTPKSTSMTSEVVDTRPEGGPKPQGDYAAHALAIVVEGKIKSAFAGRADPAVPAPAESSFRSRLLVVGSSQFLANPFARAGNPPPQPPQMAMMAPVAGDETLMMMSQPYAQQYLTETILAFKNTLDWMTLSNDVLACATIPLPAAH